MSFDGPFLALRRLQLGVYIRATVFGGTPAIRVHRAACEAPLHHGIVRHLLLAHAGHELAQRRLEVALRHPHVDLVARREFREVILRRQRVRVRVAARRRPAIELRCAHDASARASRRTGRLTDLRLDVLRLARHGLQHRVRAQRVQVRAGVVERTLRRDAREVEARVQAELARQRPEDVALRRVAVAHAQVQHAVEPARRVRKRGVRARARGRTSRAGAARGPGGPAGSWPR